MNKFSKKLESFALKVRDKGKVIILSPYHFFKFVCFSVGLIVLVLMLSLGVLAFNFNRSLPEISKMSYMDVRKLAVRTTIKKFEKTNYVSRYKWKSISDISRPFLYSIVVSEDGQYFEHAGVDYNAIFASALKNMRKKKITGGASTITQQVVKNIFLTNERSYIRKLKEVIIAERLEERFTKNQILEIYMNIAEFGPNIYGVKMMAEELFKKDTNELDAVDGALAALFLPSPRRNHLSIYTNKYLSEKNNKKIRRVLRDMRHYEYISPLQYKKYSRQNFLKLFK